MGCYPLEEMCIEALCDICEYYNVTFVVDDD